MPIRPEEGCLMPERLSTSSPNYPVDPVRYKKKSLPLGVGGGGQRYLLYFLVCNIAQYIEMDFSSPLLKTTNKKINCAFTWGHLESDPLRVACGVDMAWIPCGRWVPCTPFFLLAFLYLNLQKTYWCLQAYLQSTSINFKLSVTTFFLLHKMHLSEHFFFFLEGHVYYSQML